MRDLVMTVGGPLMPGEKLPSYFRRVARKAKISPWQARAAFYGLFRDPEESAAIWKLRESAQREANKYRKVASLLNTAASELEEIDTGGAISARTLARQLARELINLAEENGE